jgi:hypothetical protein
MSAERWRNTQPGDHYVVVPERTSLEQRRQEALAWLGRRWLLAEPINKSQISMFHRKQAG